MRLLLLTYLFVYPFLLCAQPVFVKSYDGGKYHEMSLMVPLSNGNISLAGSIDDRATVALFTAEGERIWAKKYSSGNADTYVTGLVPTTDGHLAATYYAYPNSSQPFSGIFKIDAFTGTVLWSQKLLNDSIIPFCLDIYAHQNGFLVNGYTSDAAMSQQTYGVMAQFDENGGLTWANSQVKGAYYNSICTDQAGNAFSAGSHLNGRTSPLVKYAPDGKVLWSKLLVLDTFDLPVIRSTLTLPDQTLLLGGSWNDLSQKRALLMRVDTNANIQWTKAYAFAGQSLVVYDMQVLPDGDILAVCHGGEVPAFFGKENSILLKISPDDGAVIWAKQYDNFGPKNDLLDRISSHSQGGYWLSGRASFTASSNNVLMFHTDAEFGMGSCCPREVPVAAEAIFPVFTPQAIVAPRTFTTAPVNWIVSDVSLTTALQCAPIPLDFTFADSVLCPGTCTRITVDTVLADVTYTFDLDGGTVDPMVPNSACFPGNRTYSITLTAEKAGCVKAQNSRDLLVRSIADQFPNAFTPNGDGVNDLYRPIYQCPAVVSNFRIYDRWGKLVFETQDPAQGWDGRVDGQLAPADVYAWVVDYEAIREAGKQRFSEKGDVTLLR